MNHWIQPHSSGDKWDLVAVMPIKYKIVNDSMQNYPFYQKVYELYIQ